MLNPAFRRSKKAGDFIVLFAILGISSLLLSCGKALAAWSEDKYTDFGTEPRALRCLITIFLYFGFLGVLVNPFETYLNNKFYDRMMKRVRAARYLASLTDYPSESDCLRYGFDLPISDPVSSYAPSPEFIAFCRSYGGDPYSSSEYRAAVSAFEDWRKSEYSKLGL